MYCARRAMGNGLLVPGGGTTDSGRSDRLSHAGRGRGLGATESAEEQPASIQPALEKRPWIREAENRKRVRFQIGTKIICEPVPFGFGELHALHDVLEFVDPVDALEGWRWPLETVAEEMLVLDPREIDAAAKKGVDYRPPGR